jgi:hypothetical protein
MSTRIQTTEAAHRYIQPGQTSLVLRAAAHSLGRATAGAGPPQTDPALTPPVGTGPALLAAVRDPTASAQRCTPGSSLPALRDPSSVRSCQKPERAVVPVSGLVPRRLPGQSQPCALDRDSLPPHPSVRPRALRRTTTRAPSPFRALPFHPGSQSYADGTDPSRQILVCSFRS